MDDIMIAKILRLFKDEPPLTYKDVLKHKNTICSLPTKDLKEYEDLLLRLINRDSTNISRTEFGIRKEKPFEISELYKNKGLIEYHVVLDFLNIAGPLLKTLKGKLKNTKDVKVKNILKNHITYLSKFLDIFR